MPPFEASLQAHFSVCTCTLIQSKCVVNNVGVFQESLGCVAAGCFCLLITCSSATGQYSLKSNNPILEAFYNQSR